MTRDLSEALHAHVSGRGTLAPGLSDLRARRVRNSVRNRRMARAAAAASGALATVGGIAFGAAYAADHGFLGAAPGSSPSATPTGVPNPSVTALPLPTNDVTPIVWPEQGPSAIVQMFGSQVVPLECGILLSDLPTGSVVISEARRATFAEVAAVIGDNATDHGEPSQGGVASRDSARLVLSDDMYLAAWNPGAVFMSATHSGATLSVSGLEEGFAPWDATGEDQGNIGRQLWGGYAVVEKGVIMARGHFADASVGAGTVQITASAGADPGTPAPMMILITRPWQGVEWCPGVVPGTEGRDLVAIAAATAFDIAPTYAWAELPAD